MLCIPPTSRKHEPNYTMKKVERQKKYYQKKTPEDIFVSAELAARLSGKRDFANLIKETSTHFLKGQRK